MEYSGGGGGATLSEMYQSARRLLLSARDGVARVERLASAPTSSSYYSAPLVGGGAPGDPAVGEEVRREVAQIQGLCAQMDRLWRSIPGKGQRDLWKRKVEQLSEEVDSLKETIDRHTLRQQKRILEAKERAELFERANGESSHVLRIFDDEAQAMQSARSSSRMLEEAYETGVAILHKYADQRDRLKSAQRKALDVLNTVGLSNSVLKLIERRHRVDKWIAYAGMIITVVVMIAFWRLTH
ncbi:membrin-11-like [Panicum miliaceum]|uniref:Membrin n=1 Tax=Panicum miliaceum TaxID=4540 RepID=A0A3L6SAA5_PANMI|nr:membrin-11-like [Panicum miliaceum]